MPDENAIRERAYSLWEKEGSPEGREAEFWERARLMLGSEAEPAMETPLQSRSAAEAAVDEAMADTFPASDPPAFAASTGAANDPAAASAPRKRLKSDTRSR